MTSDVAAEWDDVPSADPQIQKDYEAALGAFLVVFNRIENIVSDIIFLALKKVGRREVLKWMTGDLFARKVLSLELISLRFPEAASLTVISALRGLSNERNSLAHGHFDQNPFDGSYDIVTDRKRLNVPIARIRSLTERAERLYEQLRGSQAWFWFDDIALNEDEPTG